MTTIRTVPKSSMAIYKAAALINSAGPHQVVKLFASIDFGPNSARKGKLTYAHEIEWLRTTPDGLIDITESTRLYFASLQPKEKFVGEKAAPQYRGDWRAGSLSRQHIPNRRGPRADAPAIYGANPTFHRG